MQTDLQDLNDRGSIGGDVAVGDHGSLGFPWINKQEIIVESCTAEEAGIKRACQWALRDISLLM